ncbi:hypothetical protein L915_20546 [Phytophthora nicotianae]|uniref:Uncharacterized protein n=1 Tax=Phytophthora nicotianae TaxID=4792 RepID=W2FNI8_PHYNI|nr:hypothetical protein L915_20546 [Phytophthora nicotianae]
MRSTILYQELERTDARERLAEMMMVLAMMLNNTYLADTNEPCS